MKTANQNTNKNKASKEKMIEQAAESWANLCLYHLKQKRPSVNQNNDKKAYEYNTK